MLPKKPIAPEDILQRARAHHENMREWRRAIHRYPELGFQEHQTAGLVNRVLTNLGIETHTGIAKTGIIGHIFGTHETTVALRADMDALPIDEETNLDFRSTRAGIMHACGHDAHTAMLLGAASILKELSDDGFISGNIRLIFQPSEEWQDDEGKSGGMRMVEEGALDGVQAVFGLHIDPDTPTGYISTRSGPMLAAADTFHLEIRGAGGHASRPHETTDTIALAGLVINAIHHLISRRLDPLQAGVVTIGTIHGGSADNIIPGKVTLTGTMRSFTSQSRQVIFKELEKVVRIIEPLGGEIDLTIIPGYPPTINDPLATKVMQIAASSIVGEANLKESPMYMGSEDFSFMAQEVPGCFISLGVHDPRWGDEHCQLHQPNTRLDEDALPYGAAVLVAAALQWMQNAPTQT
jgi:amidohydrolase